MAEKSLKINIRDKRLRGGVLNISAATTRPKVRDAREAVIRALLDNGDGDVVEMIRTRRLHIADVQAAYRRGTLAELKPKEKPEPAHGLNLKAAIAKTLVVVRATKKAEGTYHEYESYGNLLMAHFGITRALDSVTHDEARDYLYAVKSRGTPWAASRQRGVRTFAARVWRTGGATTDPWKGIALATVRATRHAFLQPAEWQALYASVEGTPVALLLALSVLAGLRIMESANLRRDIDVDLEKNVIHIRPRDGQYAWYPKTENSEGTVPIGSTLRKIIARHIADGWSGDRYLIRVAKKDRPAGYATLKNWTRKAFKAVGLRYGVKNDGLTHHSLRRTFASWLAQEDVQLKKIADLLRDTVETVAKYYTWLLPTDLEKTVEVADSVAWKAAA